MRTPRPMPERFQTMTGPQDQNGCWPWLGWISPDGYGYIWTPGRRPTKRIRAHRYALIIATGQDPAGLLACHTCHNRACVNPNHLYWGTPAQNTADMIAAGHWHKPPGRTKHN